MLAALAQLGQMFTTKGHRNDYRKGCCFCWFYGDDPTQNRQLRERDFFMSEEPLKHSKSELRAAARAIESMESADSMDTFESEWRIFLACIEKVWTKIERTCQPHRNVFQPWQGSFQSLRRKDMLLRYLKQARDADNHSIQDITVMQPGRSTLRFLNPNGGYIHNLEIRNGKIVNYQGDRMIQTTTSPHPIAIPIQNNGVWYNPPTTHLGKSVPDLSPLTLATLGLAFYTDYLAQVEHKFFPNS